MRVSLTEEERSALDVELHQLQIEHSDLDAAIAALEAVGACDQLQIQRFKKRKLQLKDRMEEIFDKITPDIIA